MKKKKIKVNNNNKQRSFPHDCNKNYFYVVSFLACRANNVLSANALMDNLAGREKSADFPIPIIQYPRRDLPRDRADLT
jgi:hypothetical protein